MRLKDLKIGVQLRIGLGSILLLVVVLGATAWFQADILWQETKGLYEHPLTVQRALADIKTDILTMQRGMKDLILADDDQERHLIIQGIDTDEAGAHRQFDVLYDRYLGPRSDIDHAHTVFVQWKAIREETIRLLRVGNIAEATNRTKSTGPGGRHVKMLMDHIKEISDFAVIKGDRFYLSAQEEKNALLMRLGILLGAILLLSTGVSYGLLRGIRVPLKELTSVADKYRRGKLDVRSRYVSANEFGSLSAAFNDLAQTVQTELQSREDTARIADVMLGEEELHSFCRALLKALIQQTGSQLGAVYLLNERKTDFEHFESIGLAATGRASFSAAGREGEFGAALATHQIQRIMDIPGDTRFVFSTVGGDFTPREIMTVPILSGQDVVAMVSLASVRSYSAPAVRLVHDVWHVMIARLNGVLAFRQIRAFSERLEQQNRELEAQKQELVIQSDELSEQNIELELQKTQLDEANRLKSNFLSNMSHELRTPLNSVIALSGVLSRRLRGAIPENEYDYLEVIERNGKNLLALINDILDLSRIEAGREEIRVSAFSFRELAAEVVAMIEPQAREKGIALLNRVGHGHDLPPIRSDLSKCRHILQNIVGNAVKFTGEGRVEISAARVDDSLQIAVTDTGIGIAADQIPYIFDEFRQADESTTRNYGGTGLGLCIARKYATMLGGSIAVESTPGEGSTFTLRLPLTPDMPVTGAQATETAEQATPARSTAASSLSACRGKCILLVEDSEPVVIQMTDILADQGCCILVARNGKEALEQIEKTLPDAMILDLMMPEVDGFEVLRKIRGAEKTAQLPVLILTAKHVTREELMFLKGNHIYQLIQKGDINKKDLLEAIGKMVSPRLEKETSPVRVDPRVRLSGHPLVLIVEDNPDNLKTVKALLRDTCTVIEAADGRAGVEQARTHRPDLIFMDLSLPVMDGFKAFGAIRNEEALRHIPIIALTASAMKGNREEILAHGFDGYISKPIDGKLLENTIKEKLYGHE